MKNTILILVGIITLGTINLIASGNPTQVLDTSIESEVSNSKVDELTIAININIEESIVQVVDNITFSDTYVEYPTISINLDNQEK